MRAAKYIATGVYGVLAVPGSFLLCFGCLVYVSLSSGVDDFDANATPWRVSKAALAYGDAILVLVVVLLLSVLTIVVAHFARNVALTVIGIICGVMFALTLVMVGVDGRAGLAQLAARSAEIAPATTSQLQPMPTPTPTPTTPQLVAVDARDRVRQMIAVSLESDETLGNSGGRSILADTVELTSSACDESGVRVSTTLELRAMNNADAVRRILTAWDEAGFAPDRAMQQDIRYSQTDAVEKMTIRDATSIDGLIHMSIESRCAVP